MSATDAQRLGPSQSASSERFGVPPKTGEVISERSILGTPTQAFSQCARWSSSVQSTILLFALILSSRDFKAFAV